MTIQRRRYLSLNKYPQKIPVNIRQLPFNGFLIQLVPVDIVLVLLAGTRLFVGHHSHKVVCCAVQWRRQYNLQHVTMLIRLIDVNNRHQMALQAFAA